MGDKYLVTAPVSSFTGTLAGLLFHDGTATADSVADARALAYCRRHAYEVTPTEGAAAATSSEPDDSDRPKPAAPKGDWVAYAISRGADSDAAAEMTKADLVDQYGKKGSSDE